MMLMQCSKLIRIMSSHHGASLLPCGSRSLADAGFKTVAGLWLLHWDRVEWDGCWYVTLFHNVQTLAGNACCQSLLDCHHVEQHRAAAEHAAGIPQHNDWQQQVLAQHVEAVRAPASLMCFVCTHTCDWHPVTCLQECLRHGRSHSLRAPANSAQM